MFRAIRGLGVFLCGTVIGYVIGFILGIIGIGINFADSKTEDHKRETMDNLIHIGNAFN